MRLSILRKLRLRHLMAIVASSSLLAALATNLRSEHSAAYRAGYRQGRNEADAQFAAGLATVYTYGLPRFDAPNLDEATGLPYQPIAGCMVDDGLLGRARGHNDRLRELVDSGRPPANSRKQWIDDFNDLIRYFADLCKEQEPVRLTAGGPSVVSPDGRYRLSYAETVADRRPNACRPALIRVQRAPDVVSEASALAGPVALDVAWGPPEGKFCVVRFKFDDGSVAHQALDLEKAEWLRSKEGCRLEQYLSSDYF